MWTDDDDAEDEGEGKGDPVAVPVHRAQKAHLAGGLPQPPLLPLPPPAAAVAGLPFLPLPRPRFVAPVAADAAATAAAAGGGDMPKCGVDEVADWGEEAEEEGGLVLVEGEGEPCPWEFTEMELEQFLGDARGFVEAPDRDALRLAATRCFVVSHSVL